MIFISIPCLMVLFHEGGHYLAALCCGRKLKFRFAWGSLGPLKIPRWVWDMPNTSAVNQRIVAIAGFGLELWAASAIGLFNPAAGVAFMFLGALHLVAYPFYAGEESDFKWLV